MQNPFRTRSQDDFGRQDRDDRWENRDHRFDERPSWTEGDGGRTAEAYRNPMQGPGQYARDRDTGSRNWGYDRSQGYARDNQAGRQDEGRYGGGQDAYRSQGYGQGGSYGGSYSGQGYGRQDYDRQDYGRQDRGSPFYGRQDYPDHGYAPGSQIWEGSDRSFDRGRSSRAQHDFEPDYLHWRERQLSNFDRDYADWRNERREKFSADFDTWRSNRPRVQAENPIVGDVTDGGTGDASELKKR